MNIKDLLKINNEQTVLICNNSFNNHELELLLKKISNKKISFWVTSEHLYNILTDRDHSNSKRIKLIKPIGRGSKKNWEVVCNIIEVIYVKYVNSFEAILGDNNISQETVCRYLALSTVRNEIENLLCFCDVEGFSKIKNGIILSRFLDKDCLNLFESDLAKFDIEICYWGFSKYTKELQKRVYLVIRKFFYNVKKKLRRAIIVVKVFLRRVKRCICCVVRGEETIYSKFIKLLKISRKYTFFKCKKTIIKTDNNIKRLNFSLKSELKNNSIKKEKLNKLVYIINNGIRKFVSSLGSKFKINFKKDEVLGEEYSKIENRKQNNRASLTILVTDVRKQYFEVKIRYLLPVIIQAVSERKKVRVIVTSKKDTTFIEEYFQKFEEYDKLELVFVDNSLIQLTILAKNIKQLFKSGIICNFQHLLLRFITLKTFYKRIINHYPSDIWFSLISYIELPLIKELSKNSACLTAAVQFGVADHTHLSYKFYKLDYLFTSDKSASNAYKQTKILAENIIAVGGLETEFLLKNQTGKSLDNIAKGLEIIFLDQPILQRTEFDLVFVSDCYRFIEELSTISNINIAFKPHPRSDYTVIPKSFFHSKKIRIIENSEDLFLNYDVAISFCSALLETAPFAGVFPVYLGAKRLYEPDISNGGIVTEDLKQLKIIFEKAAYDIDCKKKLMNEVIDVNNNYICSKKPSALILESLYGECVYK